MLDISKKTQEIAGQSDRDSGYYSSRSSRQLSVRSSACVDDDVVAKPKLKLQGIKSDFQLSEFDKEVPKAIITRFHGIRVLIESALLNHVHTSGIRDRQMAIRLMVLGNNDQDARPYIVVLAAEEHSKVIIKTLKNPSIQALCRPTRRSETSLDVLVYARPPRSRSSEDFTVDIPAVNGRTGLATDTYCGAPIIVRHSSGAERHATLGGIIKGYRPDKGCILYGLTARHLLHDLQDDALADTKSLDLAEPSWLGAWDETRSAWVASGLRNLGLIRGEYLSKNFGRDHDWALVKMVDYRANRLSLSGRGASSSAELSEICGTELQMPSSPKRCHTGQSIIVISGSAGHKHGSTSALPARMLVGNGREFVDTLVVKMQPGEDIADGDSGSFVVNDRTVEVYGHVVAADDFGGGYVMPLEDTLRDIKSQFQFETVGLAYIEDVEAAKLEKRPAPAQSAASSLAAEMLRGELRQAVGKGKGRSEPPPPINIGRRETASHNRRREKPGFFRSLFHEGPVVDVGMSSADEPVVQALIVDHRTLAPWDPPDSGYGTGEGSRTTPRNSYEKN